MKHGTFDFFEIGAKHATESMQRTRVIAEDYGRRFGPEAKEEFELGVASAISQYYSIPVANANEFVGMSATNDYGVPNTRNEEYVGGEGMGIQYIEKDGEIVFNEPVGRAK